MPDLQRARTRRQSPRISAVMAESGPRVGGGKAPIARYAMSSGSIRKQRAVEGATNREPRGFDESKRAGHGPLRTNVSIARTAVRAVRLSHAPACREPPSVECTVRGPSGLGPAPAYYSEVYVVLPEVQRAQETAVRVPVVPWRTSVTYAPEIESHRRGLI